MAEAPREVPYSTDGLKFRILVGLSVLAAVGSIPHPSFGQTVTILSGPQAPYRAAVESLRTSLDNARISCKVVVLPDKADQAATDAALREATANQPKLIAAAGETAATLALKRIPDRPVVYCMVLNALDVEPLAGKETADRAAGLAADVSPQDRLRWIVKVQPTIHKIAVLHSADTVRSAEMLRKLGKDGFPGKEPESTDSGSAQEKPADTPLEHVEVVLIEAKVDAFSEAIEKLGASGCDAVLMVPDPRVYNSANVRELILWGLRQKKPVCTFSSNIVEAGACAGIWVDPQVNGAETADVIRRVLEGTQPSRIGLSYCKKTIKALNRNTADRLGIDIKPWADKGIKILGGS